MSQIEQIKQNTSLVRQSIDELKNELNILTQEYNNVLIKELREENAKLTAAVELAKNRLVQLETKQGIPQIPLPTTVACSQPKSEQVAVENVKQIVEEPKQPKTVNEPKPKKEKKTKEPKEAPEELPVDIGRLDLRIAKIEDVQKHLDADTLYVLKINCGETKPRTVCSGLVKHIPMEQLQNRTVMLLCNLKPVKMRGITSEAMVMCASSDAGVEVLIPPENCTPGEPVICDGYKRQPDPVMNPKKKIFETVAPDLHTDNELRACYKNVPLRVDSKGVIVAKSLKNVPVK